MKMKCKLSESSLLRENVQSNCDHFERNNLSSKIRFIRFILME